MVESILKSYWFHWSSSEMVNNFNCFNCHVPFLILRLGFLLAKQKKYQNKEVTKLSKAIVENIVIKRGT